MRRGFTLVELLVVLAVIALALAVAAPMVINAFPGVELKAAARDVATGLRFARTLAISRNADAVFVVDLDRRRFEVPGGSRSGSLPEGVELKLTAASSERTGERVGGIRFFPDGSSTGGGLELRREGRAYLVTVDWLTGKVSIRG